MDSPLLNNTNSGNVTFDVIIDSDKNITLTKISSIPGLTIAYPANILTKYNPTLHSLLTIYVSFFYRTGFFYKGYRLISMATKERVFDHDRIPR